MDLIRPMTAAIQVTNIVDPRWKAFCPALFNLSTDGWGLLSWMVMEEDDDDGDGDGDGDGDNDGGGDEESNGGWLEIEFHQT